MISHTQYDILALISMEDKFRKYVDPEPEPHHFFVDTKFKITSTCQHLNHILFYGHNQQNELVELDARLLFEDESILKRAFKNLETKGTIWNKELILRRKDKSKFWALMSFRLEKHEFFRDIQLYCQFININDHKVEQEELDSLTEMKLQISQNDLKIGLKDLTNILKERQETRLLNQVILIGNRYNKLIDDKRVFLIENKDFEQKSLEIRCSLLEIIDEIKIID